MRNGSKAIAFKQTSKIFERKGSFRDNLRVLREFWVKVGFLKKRLDNCMLEARLNAPSGYRDVEDKRNGGTNGIKSIFDNMGRDGIVLGCCSFHVHYKIIMKTKPITILTSLHRGLSIAPKQRGE